MYSDEHPLFNCYQRAHQNTLEFVPYFYSSLFLAGLKYPIASAVCGATFAVGRIAYALGYSTGNPENRIYGAVARTQIPYRDRTTRANYLLSIALVMPEYSLLLFNVHCVALALSP